MRIVVTGATGFIGCQLAQILAGLGHDLVATGRAASAVESARLAWLERVGVRVEVGSLLDPGFAGALIKTCEIVIHLAAAQHEGNVPDSYFRDINVRGTRLLLEAAIGAGARLRLRQHDRGLRGGERSRTHRNQYHAPPSVLRCRARSLRRHRQAADIRRMFVVFAQ